MTSELTWMMNKAKLVKTYEGECTVKEFKGKLPYRMVMNAILNNEWKTRSEGGQGKSSYWNTWEIEDGREYGIHYNCYTKVVTFTLMEALCIGH